MPTTPEGFTKRLAMLKADLIEQGRRVQTLIEAAIDSVFSLDAAAAKRTIDLDEVIDTVDVDIERAAVQLLAHATKDGAALAPDQLRMILTIVKVNNELERIADAGVHMASQVESLRATAGPLPETFRVMANSVVGILRDATVSLDRIDARLAKLVLASQDAVEEFKRTLLRDAQERLARGDLSVDRVFALHEVAVACEDMADHCTNIAEQVIYVATGAIVRHMPGHWEEIELPS